MRTSRAGRAAIGLAVISLILLPDCGTLSSGGDQGVPVTSNPPGANVFVDGRAGGQTPAFLRIRKKGDPVIRIEYPGYIPVEVRPKRKTPSFAVMGDILIGGVIGGVIAMSVGLRNDYANPGKTALIAIPLSALGMILLDSGAGPVVSPEELRINLKKASGGAGGVSGSRKNSYSFVGWAQL